MPEIMTLKEACGYLRISPWTLQKLLAARAVPASKVGGQWRFRKSTLDAWMGEQEKEAMSR